MNKALMLASAIAGPEAVAELFGNRKPGACELRAAAAQVAQKFGAMRKAVAA